MPRRPASLDPSAPEPPGRFEPTGRADGERVTGGQDRPAGGVHARVDHDGVMAAAEDARLVALLEEARRITDRLIAPVQHEDWRRSHHPVLGPVGWDVVHIAQQEDLWLAQVLGGLGEARAGENRTYDPQGNPRPVRESLPLVTKPEAARFRDQVRARTLRVLQESRRDPSDPHWRDLFLHKMIVQHEAMHDETILQHVVCFPQGNYVPAFREAKVKPRVDPTALMGFVHHAGGTFPLGAKWRAPWTFDNEWPLHAVHVDPFWLAQAPVTNAMFLQFMEAGGYEERALWSDAGWRWLQKEPLEAPLHWQQRDGEWVRREADRVLPVDPDEPVVNVSWFEADAVARFYDCRLPTEAEWEYAALWDPVAGRKRVWPWGDEEPSGAHANLDHWRWGPEPVGSHPEGASVAGVHQLVGDVWEWTASRFAPYPGFEAFPYRGYSEAFFTGEYRVLRGGSWATRSSLRLGTFRNWDFPVRRQIFAGLRLAADAPPEWAKPAPVER